MKTLLVLSENRDFIQAIRGDIESEQCRIVVRATLEEVGPMLEEGLVGVCVVEHELAGVKDIWFLKRLCRKAARCPVILYANPKESEWEGEAYLQGVAYVLGKPVCGRVLRALLERLWPVSTPARPTQPASFPAPARAGTPATAAGTAVKTMGVLRDFSSILSHSLNAEAICRQFLGMLRQVLGINRAAIFLREPANAFEPAEATEHTHRLRPACALGLPAGLLQCTELSLRAGIGGHLLKLGRILWCWGDEIRTDMEAQKEFELLGAQVAVPILDGETVSGVAVLGGRVTGEPLLNSELELVFHLLEQLGLALKNIWLHDQLVGNHEMLADILREISSACVVVGRDLSVLKANKMAFKHFASGRPDSNRLEFSDLPHALGAKVYEVLKTGAAASSFKYEPKDGGKAAFNVTVVPFPRRNVTAALLMAEDLTQSEQLRELEIEAANLRLVNAMAYRLANEIRNAITPAVAYQQMLADSWDDADFRASFSPALAKSVNRVRRLGDQMGFLPSGAPVAEETFTLAPLVEQAFQEACNHQETTRSPKLQLEAPGEPIVIRASRAAMKHAVMEIIINALQANPEDPKVKIGLSTKPTGNSLQEIQIEVQDNGAGFPAELAQEACTPFFTTRIVGSGLGLTVSRRIIESHHGKLEIFPTHPGQGGLVRISLPVASP